MTRPELRALTSVRGVAAWMVVLYHIRLTIDGLPQAWVHVFAKGYLAVDFFFLLSGFVIWLSVSGAACRLCLGATDLCQLSDNVAASDSVFVRLVRGGGGDDRSAVVKRQVKCKRRSQLLGRLGSCQQEALQQIAAQLGKQLAMFRGLDALDRHPKAACLGERDDASQKLPSLFGSCQEAPVDLHDVAGEVLEIFEVGVAGAEIVQPQPDTDLLEARLT